MKWVAQAVHPLAMMLTSPQSLRALSVERAVCVASANDAYIPTAQTIPAISTKR